LTGEALILGLAEILRNHFRHQQVFVQDLPGASVRHPGNHVGKLWIGHYHVQLCREVGVGFSVFVNPGRFETREVAVGMVDAARRRRRRPGCMMTICLMRSGMLVFVVFLW